MANTYVATVTDVDSFDELIDARSPGEFLEDHLPGAINLPVLDDAERAHVGTVYKQVSSFEAKKIGAAWVSRNIAHHLETYCADKPKSWRPLIYCWRGGSRSGSLTHILQKIGFDAHQLDGGYKAYRRVVVADLNTLPAQYFFIVVCGPTGSGKSRLLQALAAQGGQVLDLEALAAHRGSLLGALPDQAQPNQKSFESAIWAHLRRFNSSQPIFVESESKKIGALRVPEALIDRMRASVCLRLDVPQSARISLLIEEYTHYLGDPVSLQTQLGHLKQLRGHETIQAWQAMIQAQDWRGLVGDLLATHYDPAYFKSLNKNYAASEQDRSYALSDVSTAGFSALAAQVLTDLHSDTTAC
ncbi:MAG: tRNA 2-selenouridine(34) synthase MnmH [Thiobacillaceae bacterium]